LCVVKRKVPNSHVLTRGMTQEGRVQKKVWQGRIGLGEATEGGKGKGFGVNRVSGGPSEIVVGAGGNKTESESGGRGVMCRGEKGTSGGWWAWGWSNNLLKLRMKERIWGGGRCIRVILKKNQRGG